ncbi:MAG: zinc-dependent peptidase [Acidimicrobiia bacterium]|nr:zinc-dependent peptidase [Acidimicrobiia bacterium]
MNRKSARALSVPFPDEWRSALARDLRWWSTLDSDERARMEDLIRVFLADKTFEGTRDFDTTEEMRLMIAAQACLLVLGLEYAWYDDVTSIIVSPTIMTTRRPRNLDGGVVSGDTTRLAGQALLHGPVLIVWDQARRQARNPERGHNVVFHEFAHKLDMRNGAVDGVPPLSRELASRWQPEMASLLSRIRAGEAPTLNPYGATNPAELLAVATELFFAIPDVLVEFEPRLYSLLADFYHQDPAARLPDLDVEPI